MKTLTKDMLLISAVLLALSGAARADGDGGDNSMSQWTGDSYAAFQRGDMGDFYNDRKAIARTDETTAETRTHLASAPADVHSALNRKPNNPFRDDTAG